VKKIEIFWCLLLLKNVKKIKINSAGHYSVMSLNLPNKLNISPSPAYHYLVHRRVSEEKQPNLWFSQSNYFGHDW
jgi:hypothetical protein